ncbi:MAG: hypothetical protein D3916_18115 [Candidatus Electrothrix sp. MAN1_4]|nr:hypothetical protein [Candidatus Electrothrix sp. MAN1_4]
MRTVIRLLILSFVLCGHGYALAAETIVEPGDGTLLAAVTAATSGDTLILRDGSYYGGSLTIDKSLTIRAISSEAEPVVSSLTISGAGVNVTLQGLYFTSSLNLSTAGNVRLLENTLLDGNINCASTSGKPEALVAIGNHLIDGSIYDIGTEESYIAGNILDDGYIKASRSIWIVGNEIKGDQVHCIGTSCYSKIYVSTSGDVRIIGNRITLADCSSNSAMKAIYVSSSYSALIAGNIIEYQDIGTTPDTAYGIRANASKKAQIQLEKVFKKCWTFFLIRV